MRETLSTLVQSWIIWKHGQHTEAPDASSVSGFGENNNLGDQGLSNHTIVVFYGPPSRLAMPEACEAASLTTWRHPVRAVHVAVARPRLASGSPYCLLMGLVHHKKRKTTVYSFVIALVQCFQ
jgi:hypothetical protein